MEVSSSNSIADRCIPSGWENAHSFCWGPDGNGRREERIAKMRIVCWQVQVDTVGKSGNGAHDRRNITRLPIRRLGDDPSFVIVADRRRPAAAIEQPT